MNSTFGNSVMVSNRFHSTNFPSEWGHMLASMLLLLLEVSIQLISPASGDLTKLQEQMANLQTFPFN